MCQSGQATAITFGSGCLKFQKKKKKKIFSINLLKILGIRKLVQFWFFLNFRDDGSLLG
jgi:hypothetical protein